MKTFKLLISLILLSFVYTNAKAQISYGGSPISFNKTRTLSENIDNIILTPPNMEEVRAEDIRDSINGAPYKFARVLNTNVSLENAGTWESLENGISLWRLKITSPGAKSLIILYDDFYLPEGSKLFLYNESRTHIIGAFDHRTMQRYGNKFSTQMVEGETTYLELQLDSYVTETPRISIEGVLYSYRGVNRFVQRYNPKVRETQFGQSGGCNINVNCPEGENWTNQKKGVAEIVCISGDAGMYCTGSLINNTSQDGTPYFLSADHCLGEGAPSSFSQWQFYFNFESPDCNNPASAPPYSSVSGAMRIARPSGAQGAGTDFLLLKLNTNETELASFGAYYNGWNKSSTPSQSGVGIHHPSGDMKKISTYSTPLTVVTPTGLEPDGSWLAVWASGVTEQGSSGSPLFNTTGHIVGSLIGGLSGCEEPPENQKDAYGRFDYHWDKDGTNNANRLKPWLDPLNSDPTVLDGKFAGGTPIVSLKAAFIGNPTSVGIGASVTFTDKSTGNPTSWAWTFNGGSPATSSEQNPVVSYVAAGVYDVKLQITDASGDTNEELKTGYIKVAEAAPPTDVVASFVASNYNITAGDCVNFNDQSTGEPTTWIWSFPGANVGSSTDKNPANICYNSPGEYNVTLLVKNATSQDTKVCQACIKVSSNVNFPVANFEADQTSILEGGVVNFTNLSENGPMDSWAWTFYGGTPASSNEEVPPPVTYSTAGVYSVELRCRKESSGKQDVKIKTGYITVVPQSTSLPVANFTASRMIIQPGETVNFIDLSAGNPFVWLWEFEGATTPTSDQKNPQNIEYNNPGMYKVSLTVTNSLGFDKVVKESFIIVSVEDPCTEAPVPSFTSSSRLIGKGQEVRFENLSTGMPSTYQWSFPGGVPSSSLDASPAVPIVYKTPGIYDVTLTVSNKCGSNTLTKEKYIYVFTAPVDEFCDTLKNLKNDDIVKLSQMPNGEWGYLGGHNGDKIRAYANYYDSYSFSEIRKIAVPVFKSLGGNVKASVKFAVWDDDNGLPGEILGEVKVLLKDLIENQVNEIALKNPISTNGPFFLGVRLKYEDKNNDGTNDDMFALGVAERQQTSQNSLYMLKSGKWKTANEMYNLSAALAIFPYSCIVDIEEVVNDIDIKIYPNPSSGIAQVEINDFDVLNSLNVEVLDALGRKINPIISKHANLISIDLSNYPNGMYFIKFITDNGIVSRKLLLAR